jgi:uncharacterized protein
MKQLIPQGYCLKCQGCCRFRESSSVWLPCLLDEEIQGLLDRKDIPAATISMDKKIQPVQFPGGEGFVCAFLSPEENKCKIFETRPFECQLYPFLINLRDKKVILTVDLNCSYVKDNINTKEFKEYADYLADFMNLRPQLKLLRDNPQIIQAYEEVLDIIELNINDEIK